MSQSPVDDFSEASVSPYRLGWRALNRLLHQDRSFSGRERNCAYLNTGGDRPSFADVSGVTGFDFDDDGRGLALADWDFDGDQDVWITNRTAPRVRFLKNNSAPSNQFVAFKLQGNGKNTNRDAIGARLELFLTGTAAPQRIRTLRGGEGFLSQSSHWIHFGLGDADGIAKLVVKWPGASPQEFTGLKPGSFYRLIQGTPEAQVFPPPSPRAPLTAAEQVATPEVDTTRTIVPAGLPFPRLEVMAADGTVVEHSLSQSKPTLLNIWSGSCEGCVAELTEWSRHSKELLATGVEILTLSTDHLAEGEADSDAITKTALLQTASPFPNKSISPSSLQTLDALQKSVLDRWTDLPVPSTFLINPAGELVAFYKGAVAPRQLLRDLPLTGATPEARRDAALTFPGKWVGAPYPADPNRVAAMLMDHSSVLPAIHYLERSVAFLEPRSREADGQRNLGDLYYMVGILNASNPTRRDRAITQLTRARDLVPHDIRVRTELGKVLSAAGKFREALNELTAASQINPGDDRLRLDIGLLHFRLGEWATARESFRAVLASNPENAFGEYHLANTEVRLGNLPAAIAGYRKALRKEPKMLEAANNLAWILASHPDPKLRGDQEALELTRRLCAVTDNKDPRYLDSLSVALANSGDFPAAIQAAQSSIAIWDAKNKQASEAVKARLALYQAGQPFREAGWK
ncbi:MAG: ASPIC/UnbV domain-containing protein [Verrucomicrobiales bacterium]